jgi:hypothetical protein
MMQAEVAGARAALDRIDPGAVAHGSLLQLLVECRALAKRACAVSDQQQAPRRRA